LNHLNFMNSKQKCINLTWLHIVLLFALTGSFIPVAQALSIGDTVIRACPICRNAFRELTIGSGNTMGAKLWTDGYLDAPMLPMMPQLVKCAHCQGHVWIKDAQVVDRFPISFELSPDAVWKEDWFVTKEEWPELVRSRSKWHKVQEPLEATETDYLVAAQAKGISRDQELHARRRAWWLANEPARTNVNHVVEWTSARRKNLEQLAALFKTTEPCELLWIAEIYRELGEFDGCLELLKQPVQGDSAVAAAIVRQRAQEKRTGVEQLPDRP
jgi:hypothetical protein